MSVAGGWSTRQDGANAWPRYSSTTEERAKTEDRGTEPPPTVGAGFVRRASGPVKSSVLSLIFLTRLRILQVLLCFADLLQLFIEFRRFALELQRQVA